MHPYIFPVVHLQVNKKVSTLYISTIHSGFPKYFPPILIILRAFQKKTHEANIAIPTLLLVTKGDSQWLCDGLTILRLDGGGAGLRNPVF